jgi:hypothetical protein
MDIPIIKKIAKRKENKKKEEDKSKFTIEKGVTINDFLRDAAITSHWLWPSSLWYVPAEQGTGNVELRTQKEPVGQMPYMSVQLSEEHTGVADGAPRVAQ